MSVVVFGGYGTFGTLACRELVAAGVPVVVAGRDRTRAEGLAAELGSGARGLAVDLRDRAAVDATLRGQRVAVNCAGPFSAVGESLVDACLDAGCHHVDIADDRAFVRAVKARDGRFRALSLTAATGCSSLPGVSGALAALAAEGAPAPPVHATATLFIGNANRKGEAAIRSMLRTLGRRFEAPQGFLVGFQGPEVVRLPPPFGARRAYDFESPDYDLLPAQLGVTSVRVKVGFELRLGMAVLAVMARLGTGWSEDLAPLFARLGGLTRKTGHSGGAVAVELLLADGSVRGAALSSTAAGQRMAAVPAALAALALLQNDELPRGVCTAPELLGAENLVRALVGRGFTLTRTP